MNATNTHTPGPDFPVTLTYDNRTGAHGVGCVRFPDDFALDTAGGPGADPRAMPAYRKAMMREVCRRWNIHGTMVAFLDRIASRTGQVTPAMRYADLHDAKAILTLARGS